ncbi:MAG: LPS-assembly protein LptD [Pseudomonadota bacterium]|uniref:LPS-assembly protein LptD n=1 Tax=Phenylobacterium sp. TaxID=1871053 RepID=UPI0025E2A539|nr:LPS-assembly protein LptD [Phenylobacterium sp.]MBT9472353.1 LPS-assembly protein LptD [Phenylobacterium sp.]
MSFGRRSASAKRGLLAGVALVVLVGGAHSALAQETARVAAPSPDGLAEGQLYMEADLVIRDDKNKVTTAKGDVEVRYQGRTLRANELVYDETKGTMRAQGDTSIINADGSVEYADEIVLDDQMKAGVATGFSARLPQNIKMAAASAVHRNDKINELNRAIYTPCPICAPDGTTPKAPTWSIKADRVVQDKDRQLIYYRNAVVQIMGVPLVYLPVFWHPDPQAKRKSGLLPPEISVSERRGLSYEQPYLFVLSPHSDLTLSPQINTKVNPLLNGQFRKRFYSGAVDARFGYTYDKDIAAAPGQTINDTTSRSYVLASGAFAINQDWRWGFTAERTSDDLLFDKYDIGGVYENRGPYVADDRRLISQLYAIRQDQKSYFSVAAFTIQGLRPEDNDRTFPIAAPLIEARWEADPKIMGGRLRVRGSAIALTRDQSPVGAPPLHLDGLDSRRATGELDWRTTYTSAAGIRVSPYIQARLDAYSVDDNFAGMVGTASRSDSMTRAMAVAGADVSYPFFRRFKDFTAILEPLVQIAASPDVKQIELGRNAIGDLVYLNEDSIAFEFDDTNLFRANKFPGYDLYEDGLRANVGARASILWDDGRRASLLVGRSLRTQTNDVFAEQSGLRPKASDWIVAATAEPVRGLSFFTRARLDADNLEVARAEMGANIYNKWGNGYVRYLRDRANPNNNKVENLDLGGQINVTKNWGVTAYGNRDMVENAWVIRDLGVFYRDDCTRIDFIYRKEDTLRGRLGPSASFTVRLTLATLGEPIYAN